MGDLLLVQLSTEEREALSRLPYLELLIKRLATQQASTQTSKPVDRKDLLSPRKVGLMCGCNAETVRKAVVMGLLDAIPLQRTRGGRQGLLITREAAAGWLARGRPVK